MTTEAEAKRAVIPFTLHHEGGLSVDPRDAGNWTGGKVGRGKLVGTKYGISAAAYPLLDIRGLTVQQAADLYWRDYILRPGFADLPLPLLLVIEEVAVNCGPARAKQFLATAPATMPLADRVRAVCAANLAFHKRLKTWSIYGKGWSTRIADGQRQALLLATAAPVAIPVALAPPRVETRRAAPRAAHQEPAGWLAHALCWLTDQFVTTPAPLRT